MLNYNFIQGNAIERIHLQLCINVLRVKRTTQHEFVYGELVRVNYQCSYKLLGKTFTYK